MLLEKWGVAVFTYHWSFDSRISWPIISVSKSRPNAPICHGSRQNWVWCTGICNSLRPTSCFFTLKIQSVLLENDSLLRNAVTCFHTVSVNRYWKLIILFSLWCSEGCYRLATKSTKSTLHWQSMLLLIIITAEAPRQGELVFISADRWQSLYNEARKIVRGIKKIDWLRCAHRPFQTKMENA